MDNPEQEPPSTPHDSTDDDRRSAMWAHLGAGIADLLCVFVFLAWIPPLIVFLAKRDQSGFAAFHALQSLVLQLIVVAVNFVLLLASIVGLPCVAAPLAFLINVGAFVYALLIALKAKEGEWAEYLLIGDLARRLAGSD